VAARVPDWAQLAPDAVCARRRGRPRAARAQSGPPRSPARAAGGPAIQLALLRFVKNGSGIAPLIEAIGDEARPERASSGGLPHRPVRRRLDLTPEERAEFEERDRL